MKILLSMIIFIITISSLKAEKVVATVNGSDITLNDIQIILSNNPNMQYDKLPPNIQDEVISKAIEKELLTQEALKSNVATTKEYKSALAIFKKNLSFNLWLKKEAQTMSASKSEIKSYYKENKEIFSQKSSVKARHILVDSEAEAKKIIKKLKRYSGSKLKKEFIKMAKEKSKGPSSSNGGSLGWFEKGKMVPEFSKAAFKLKKKSITKKPVKTQFGYHIIYVEDKKKGGTKKLSEVKEQIENAIKSKKFQQYITKKTKKLRRKSKIKILDK